MSLKPGKENPSKGANPTCSALVSKGETDVFPVLDALMGNNQSEMNTGTAVFTKQISHLVFTQTEEKLNLKSLDPAMILTVFILQLNSAL